MGTSIAAVFAAADVPVLLQDTDPARLEAVPAELGRIAQELRVAGLLDHREAATLPDRVRTIPSLETLAGQTFVLEAVPERLPLKRAVYAALEAVLAPEAVIASNTSGLMPSALAAELARPARFLVAHFWNPAHAIPLVEVVPCANTSASALDRTVALLRHIGQEPVVIRREIPGFIGNRLQYALLREALAIVRMGAASAAEVDAVMRVSLGRRLAITGPIETADLGGLDTFLSIAEHLMPELAKDEEVLDLIRSHVAAGETGARSGQGFYTWPPDRLATVRARRNGELLRHKRAERHP
jgi:3-hydroxybutyryl-CoA dehydrogenase